MRFGWIALGTLIGYAIYRQAQAVEATEPRRTFERKLQPKHEIQPSEAREPVVTIIEDVVHDPAVPQTPLKVAFEHAIEKH